MVACMPFALDDSCKEAVRFLERVDTNIFDDHTKVMRCCQRAKAASGAGHEHLQVFVFAVECIAVSLLAGNAQDASVFTTEVIAGKSGKGDPGLILTAAVKMKIAGWFLQYIGCKLSPASGGESDALVTVEGFRELRNAFASPHAFYQKFARERNASEQEACTLRCLVDQDSFRNSLKGSAEPAAFKFLCVLFLFEGDDEAAGLAASGRSFTSYFEDADEEAAASGAEESTPLQCAFARFRKSLADAPVDAECHDHIEDFKCDDGQSEDKAKIYNIVMTRRKDRQTFYVLRNWDKKRIGRWW